MTRYKKHWIWILVLGLGVILLYSRISWTDHFNKAAARNVTLQHHVEPTNTSGRIAQDYDSVELRYKTSSGRAAVPPNAVVLPYTASANGTVLIQEEYGVMPRDRVQKLYHATSSNYKHIAPPNYMRSFKSPCWVQENVAYDPGWFGEAMLNCLPYFYVVGFPKSASTDIYSKINSHPHVLYPRIKEMFFWGSGKPLSTYFDTDLKPALETLRLKCTSGYPCPYIFGDGTVGYIYLNTAKVLSPIHHFMPNAKIIVSVRDPVERMYSSYVHFVKAPTSSPGHFHQRVQECLPKWTQCRRSQSMEQCVDKLHDACKQLDVWGCMYQVHINRWRRVVGPKNFYVVQYEQWKKDMSGELKKLFNYLELAPLPDDFYQIVVAKEHRNKRTVHAGRDLRPMRNDTREQLRAFFHPYNTELATLLNDTKWIYNKGP